MELKAWLGEDPAEVIERSHYERVRSRMDLLLKMTMVVLPSGLVIVVVSAFKGSFSDTGADEGTLGAWLGYGGVFLLAAGAVLGAMANRLWRACRRAYRDLLVRLAAELGLKYTRRKPSDPCDQFAMWVRGEVEGREVVLRRDPRGLVQASGSVCVLSVACPKAPLASMYIGSHRDGRDEPTAVGSDEVREGERAWKGGTLSPGMVADMKIGEVLVLDGMSQVEILVDDGWVALSYSLGSPVLDFHPQFVKQALEAALEMAERVEQRAAELPPDAATEAPGEG